MKISNISINNTIAEVETLLAKENSISPALRAAIKVIIMLLQIFAEKFGLNSKNSSKPPSTDPNRKRKSEKESGAKKVGGQHGHIGVRLSKVDNPDVVKMINLDRRTLPRGHYKVIGYEARQVVDIEISTIITEYRAQILEDEKGKRYVAEFPEGVKSEVQYGNEIKIHAVYMSQFQLLPYQRIQDYFNDQVDISLSTGSLVNFNQDAYGRLECFEKIVKNKLADSKVVNADETGINVNGKRLWLHSASNDLWTYFCPHAKRGNEAMDDIGILPKFTGVLCHDHWKPYYKYSCQHALCNAHHLRELTRVEEDYKQTWATAMKELLLKINEAVQNAGGKLEKQEAEQYRTRYREILKNADETECLPPEKLNREKKRGRIKKTIPRNLLERLMKFENDVLRFMEDEVTPFTNNQGENDLRMTKVQQKISGCFRSMEGAHTFCRIRGYLLTCRKHGMTATEALRIMFAGKLPNFINST